MGGRNLRVHPAHSPVPASPSSAYAGEGEVAPSTPPGSGTDVEAEDRPLLLVPAIARVRSAADDGATDGPIAFIVDSAAAVADRDNDLVATEAGAEAVRLEAAAMMRIDDIIIGG